LTRCLPASPLFPYTTLFRSFLARGRDVTLLARISPRVIDDKLVFLEEVVGDFHRFLEQPAGIAAQVEDEPVERFRVELRKRLSQLVAGRLAEFRKTDVADSGAELEGVFHARVRNLVPDNFKLQRLGRHLSIDRDM